MRYLQADFLFPGGGDPLAGAVVAVEADGTVADILPAGRAPRSTTRFRGILCPGFVNAHCHLELSGMKGLIAEGNGLAGFIGEFMRKRDDGVTGEPAMAAADREMAANGIVAVADIANTARSVRVKAASPLYYHTFVEVFGTADEQAGEIIARGLDVLGQFPAGRASLTPHAPYSVSDSLFEAIGRLADGRSPLSIHNQESESENEMFEKGTGVLAAFFRSAGITLRMTGPAGSSPLHRVLDRLPAAVPLLLVHNTFTRPGDLDEAKRRHRPVAWCFCPNANLYVERSLPDFMLFHRAGAMCCLGTDSYATNHGLSLLDEMKTVCRHVPSVPLRDLVDWATVNGAQVLGIDDRVGSIAPGKRPGINLIRGIAGGERLTEGSSVQKLV